MDSKRTASWVVGLALALALGACAATRASPGEAERIAEVMRVGPGMVVADVGAGDGEWTEDLARRVGSAGRVIATEVEEDDLETIRERLADAGVENVAVVLGTQDDMGLEAGCCDAILLRLVYHHFQNPGPMRAGLRRALRPGGRLLVIDIVPQTHWRELPGVPDRGGHGIPDDDLARELEAEGFELVERHDDWNGDEERYGLVFRLATAGNEG